MKRVKLFFAATAMILLGAVSGFAQNITVRGTITDESGETLPGAAVIVEGTTIGVNADAAGMYEVKAPAQGTLVVSLIGYKEVKVPVDGRGQVDIVLSVDSQQLEDVIVVAYGTSTKEAFTGSAAVVDEKTIEKKIATNVTSALAGTTPGVQMISSSGDPASNASTIRIRGVGSMSASNSPLIIVDGVPYDGSISDINPNDVSNMSVLKDASASAIYGHRGANGVILITTKKGEAGEAVVRLDAKVGVNSRLIPQYNVIDNPAEYYETWYKLMYNNYFYSGHSVADSYAYADANLFNGNAGGLGYQVYTVPEGQKLIGTNFKLNPNATLGYSDGQYTYLPDDWYDETFHNSIRQEYNLSVSGSSDKFNYYASFGYLDDGGVVDNSEYQRYTGRINSEYQAKKWLRFSTNMSFSHSDSETPTYTTSDWASSGNVFYLANNIGPIYPLYVRDAEGNIMHANGHKVYDFNQTNFKRPTFVGNAIFANEVDKSNTAVDMINGKVGATVTPIKDLSLSANVGFLADNTRTNELGSYEDPNQASHDGYAQVKSSRYFTVNQQYLATYKHSWNDVHNFDVLAGYEQYNLKTQNNWGYNEFLFDPFIGELNNADGIDSKQLGSATSTYMTEGFLGRAQYNYDEKYFVSASIRRDASSRFAKGHRWGTFWSFGGAWLLSKENFMSDIDWVDELKLKVSYGQQGNDNYGQQGNDNLGSYYPYSDQYSHSYDGTKYSISLGYKGNEDLTWETSKSFNVGTEFSLFGGYLNGELDYFRRKTEDLLYDKNVPLSSGNPTGVVPVNVGSIMNSGFEVQLGGNIINNRNIHWDWNLNLSHYHNEILSLDESVSEKGIRRSNYIYTVGGSLYEAYIYKFAGVDPETGESTFYKKVMDKDGNWTGESEVTKTFDEADQYDIGTTMPDVYGGFGTTFSAYGFDLSAQFSFQLGGKYYDGTYQNMMLTQGTTSAGQNIHKDLLDAWTPENTNTNVPRLDGDAQVAQSALDRFMTSSDYLSVNNVTLGYTFPEKIAHTLKLASLRVYVAGENLAVFSARKGMDPRFSMGIGSMTSGAGRNSDGYSAMRTITGGVTLTF